MAKPKNMKDFENAKNLGDKLTPEVKKAFERLKDNSDWQIAKSYIEEYILLHAYNLLSSQGTDDETIRELQGRRGFVKAWREINRLMEKNEPAET